MLPVVLDVLIVAADDSLYREQYLSRQVYTDVLDHRRLSVPAVEYPESWDYLDLTSTVRPIPNRGGVLGKPIPLSEKGLDRLLQVLKDQGREYEDIEEVRKLQRRGVIAPGQYYRIERSENGYLDRWCWRVRVPSELPGRLRKMYRDYGEVRW